VARKKKGGTANLARIALNAGRRQSKSETEVVDIITFIESDWGLGMTLFPVQRVILKAHYGIPLDDNPNNTFVITDWKRENPREFTEAGYLAWLYEEKRCNIKTVIPGQERRNLILPIGRRSGKTLLSSCIAAYETYKLINKGNPQNYYGVAPSNPIRLVSVATGKEQASLLYEEVSHHFVKCNFFRRYTANNTMSYARFQTPHDIEEFGSYSENPQARASIKVFFAACNAKSLRGQGNIVIILDEVAHFLEQGGSSAEEVYAAVAPSNAAFTPKSDLGDLADGEEEPLSDGRVIMISSPLGRQGLFFQKFMQGMSGGEGAENMLCVQAPTWEVNPEITASVFKEHYAFDPRMFRQEFGADFSDRTLGWLDDANDLLDCIDKTHKVKSRGRARTPYFVGFDLGLVKDASAIAITHIDEQSRIVLDYIGEIKAGEGEYANVDRLDFEGIATWIHLLSRRFHFHRGLFDQYAAIPLEQALHKKGLSMFEGKLFTPREKSDIWANFKSMLWDRLGGEAPSDVQEPVHR